MTDKIFSRQSDCRRCGMPNVGLDFGIKEDKVYFNYTDCDHEDHRAYSYGVSFPKENYLEALEELRKSGKARLGEPLGQCLEFFMDDDGNVDLRFQGGMCGNVGISFMTRFKIEDISINGD